MRIALMGGRGIPANYGGFETMMEELSTRLVARGHAVTVYCRVPQIQHAGDVYRGVRLVKLPTIRHKHLDTIVHTTLSAVHALGQRYDLVLMVIAGNSVVSWIPRLAGQKVILHVDGLDWRRVKWGAFARRYIQWAERLALVFPDAFITDSHVVADYYHDRFGRRPDGVVAYGADSTLRAPGETLARFGLKSREYILFVGRLVQENCVHHLVEACRDFGPEWPCVIVGDAPYEAEYIARLRAMAGPHTRFTGYLFGEGYRELCSNAYVFVEPSEVGGTHPALLEAMALGNCVIANGISENREALGGAGIAYDGQEGPVALRRILAHLLAAPDEVAEYRGRALAYAAQHYHWDEITTRYEELFARVRGGTGRARAVADGV